MLRWCTPMLLAMSFCNCGITTSANGGPGAAAAGKAVRIGFLHHSTGQNVWNGGVPQFMDSWNKAHGTSYWIQEMTYPSTVGSHPWLGRILPIRIYRKLFTDYPWANYPYDYWNLWINHRNDSRDRGEYNLEDLTSRFDVIVLKHCYPVSGIKADSGRPSASSSERTLENYKLQYALLKERMHQFPAVKFVVWTPPALTESQTTREEAERARQFSIWIKTEWDEPNDNIFIWDFRTLETIDNLFLKPELSETADDPHPNLRFAQEVAPLFGKRLVDVIEGRGDSGRLTGE